MRIMYHIIGTNRYFPIKCQGNNSEMRNKMAKCKKQNNLDTSYLCLNAQLTFTFGVYILYVTYIRQCGALAQVKK